MFDLNHQKISQTSVEHFIAPEGLINEIIDDDLGKIMGREYFPHIKPEM